MAEDELLSMSKTATTFGVSERTVWRWIASGVIRPVRVGGRSYVSTSEVRRVQGFGGES